LVFVELPVDTFIFLLILGSWWVVVTSDDRRRVFGAFGVSLVAVLLLFNHHVTSSLDLSF
jgi:hypothetical protein